jgi:tetratricopeptide (TPR) repeat protein
LDWSLTRDTGGEASLRLSAALLAFWLRRGYISEGRAWLGRALSSQTSPRGGAARAKALYSAGILAQRQGDNIAKAFLEESASSWQALESAGQNGLAYALATLSTVVQGGGDPATARSLADQAARLFREQDDHWGLAYALISLGVALRDQEDFTLARSILNESIAMWRDLGDLWGLEMVMGALAAVALRQGDYGVAQHHYADRLAIATKLGDQEGVAIANFGLGVTTLNFGDHAQAKPYFAKAYSLFRESSNTSWQAECLYWSGLIAQMEGDSRQAKLCFKQVLTLAHEIGPLVLRAGALMGLAGVAAADGQVLRAARLLGAADTQLEAGASYWDTVESRYIAHAVDIAMERLGESAFEAARLEGRGMTFEQAANYALPEN